MSGSASHGGTRLVKGTKVVSLADGTTLGSIDHVYLNPGTKEIVGFSFHQGGGLFGGKTSGLVEVVDIHAVGPDAVTITDVACVRSDLAIGSRVDDLIDLEAMLKLKVITDGGSELGHIAAVEFGQESYRLTAIEVSGGPLREHQRLSADLISLIGTELVVITEPEPAVAAAPVRRSLVHVVERNERHVATA